MHAGKRAMAVFLLMLLPASGAWAQSRAYGGRGEDKLLEIAEAGSGLFAVGMTASDDGDLSARTRLGDAGWAMLLDESGERVWSYASAHTGLARMIAPAALEDGRCSLVLTDEAAQRAEWIVLDGTGKALSRTLLLPERAEGETVLQYLPVSQETPELAMILRCGDALRAVTLGENGGVLREQTFTMQEQGIAASDGMGMLVWISAYEGGIELLWLDGEDEKPGRIALETVQVTAVCDALMQADGSVLCCGEAEADGVKKGFLARVNREGELLFAHVFPFAQRHVCQTETGFAAYGTDGQEAQLFFTDEDGGVLDTQGDVPVDVLDIAGMPGGAALLTHTEGRRQPQAVITAVQQRAQTEEDAEKAEEETEEAVQAYAPAAPLTMPDGYLVCGESDSFGVQVTCMDGSGAQKWSTRIPIHTAADALEWLCAAQLEDGSILLGGRYLTGKGEKTMQEGVIALLSGDGVLRRIEMIAGGAVCALEALPDGSVTLHAATGAEPGIEPDAELSYRP